MVCVFSVSLHGSACSGRVEQHWGEGTFVDKERQVQAQPGTALTFHRWAYGGVLLLSPRGTLSSTGATSQTRLSTISKVVSPHQDVL